MTPEAQIERLTLLHGYAIRAAISSYHARIMFGLVLATVPLVISQIATARLDMPWQIIAMLAAWTVWTAAVRVMTFLALKGTAMYAIDQAAEMAGEIEAECDTTG